MLGYLQQAAAYLAMLLIVSRSARGLATGEHAHLFHNLCELLTAPTKIAATPDDTYTAKTDYLKILQLNTSLSEAEWRSKFAKPDKGKPRPQYQKPNQGEDTIQKKRWPDWIAAEEGIEEPNKAAVIEKRGGLGGASENTRQIYLKLLQPAAEEAAAIHGDLITLTQETAEDTIPRIIAALNAGLFGKAERKATVLDNDKLKNSATIHKTLCWQAGTNAKVEALIAISLCVCGNGASSGAQDLCISDQDNTQLDAGLTNLNTLGQDLVARCQHSKRPITGAELTAAIGSLTTNFQTKATNLYIGTYANTACSGNTGQGVCAMYKTQSKSDVETINNMPWRKELIQAATLLRSREAKRAQILAGNQKLQKLKTLAFSMLPQVQQIRKQQAQQKPPKPLTKANKEEQTSKTKECEGIRKASDCRQKGECKWEGGDAKDGKHCKLNETNVAKQAAQAGAGDGAADKKEEKFKGKKQKDCKSPDCKWEGEDCRDSSLFK
uniref:Variant surface glycoprotein 730 n=1 Tax=Trypanosoma brucei TaxID=5691 RepID=M4SU92_9TRYP|nr:variant surface glycoprotein 730 [Trypanosoma brucei]